ncbi:CU044_2847 family protein [Streptomyces sp. NPDC058295]|uniref:CU044_2847 family protein n=1 Tax=Streptomyces sp. NPDC058295 TaxID=3346431 RepID=UPI0036EAA19F
MRSVVRVPLEGGGVIQFEAAAEHDGPVKVGRFGDAVRELPQTLQQSLTPVGDAARAVLEQLRRAGPDEVEVEFGVTLSAEAGAVISKGTGAVHMKVRASWSGTGIPQ